MRENGEERDAKEKREGEREKWEEGRERERNAAAQTCVRVNAAERGGEREREREESE